ncbi:MAG TPA: hypothetical protein VFR52_08640 [Sphingomicrobium sp.]|nr:hypothetical protein [Sphingomicrobium sp.]
MIPRCTLAIVVTAGLLALSEAPATQLVTDPTVTAQSTGEDIYDVSVEGSRFTSRDAVERQLLVETAKFTLRNGKDWFRLLEMPGEGTGMHPLRPVPEYGEKYRNWHPQWAYRLDGEQWQRWRPEWGATFWADSIDLRDLVAFQANALVMLGSGPKPQEGDIFEARAVLGDLAPSAK